MQRLAATAFSSLAMSILLAGCGLDSQVAAQAGPPDEPIAGSVLVYEPAPESHPALPEGHPPLYRSGPELPPGHPSLLPPGHPPIPAGECPAGGMHGFGSAPAEVATGPEIVST
jgi:hypothetical protein